MSTRTGITVSVQRNRDSYYRTGETTSVAFVRATDGKNLCWLPLDAVRALLGVMEEVQNGQERIMPITLRGTFLPLIHDHVFVPGPVPGKCWHDGPHCEEPEERHEKREP